MKENQVLTEHEMAAPILVKTKGRLHFAKNCCKETQQTYTWDW
jgi:hypothetical protein